MEWFCSVSVVVKWSAVATHDDVKRVALVINFNQVQDVKRQFSIEWKSGRFNRSEFEVSFVSIEIGAVECTLTATAKDWGLAEK